MEPVLVAHGGAGSGKQPNAEAVLMDATEAGRETLDTGTAVDAAETVVNQLEAAPQFNAGRGAKLQLDGTARLEAAIMDSELNCGAITGLKDVVHAVSVARDVMDQTHHVMIGNGHANEFAEQMGYTQTDLTTDHATAQWDDLRDGLDGLTFTETIERLKDMDTGGTVGCVVRDRDGRLAAATSTGGRSPQLAGRIGDTPLIGCGTYCNETAAISATGIGEAIVRTTLARRCCDRIVRGDDPQAAAEDAIQFLADRTGRHAGLITVTQDGRVGIDHNADAMPTAVNKG